MYTWPVVRVSRPATQCMSVDFPEPDGPMIAVKRSGSNATETSSRARTAVSPLPYTLVPCTTRAAAVRVAGSWRAVAVMGAPSDGGFVDARPTLRNGAPAVVARPEVPALLPRVYGTSPRGCGRRTQVRSASAQPGRTSPDS